jgi:WD40 repeat protein
VFSKGGHLRIFDPSSSPISPEILFSHTLNNPPDTDTVALGLCEHILYATTATGTTLLLDLTTSLARTIEFPGPISAFATSSNLDPSGLPAIFATGSQNCEVELFHPFSMLSGTSCNISCVSFWKSKNVKPTPLKLEVPIHTSQIIFLSSVGEHRLLVASKYGHLRVYDTAVSRRPIFTTELPKSEVSRLRIHPDSTLPPTDQPLVAIQGLEADKAKLSVDLHVVYANTDGHFAVYNLHERREMGLFKDLTGAVLGVDVDAQHGLVAGVGFGRYLAVYDATSRELKTRVYVKTQGCSVVVLDGEDHVVGTEKNQDEEDDVWKSMQEVDSICDGEDGDMTDKLVKVRVKRKKEGMRGDTAKRPKIEDD